jgi:phage/plasmid-associated DNA primase
MDNGGREAMLYDLLEFDYSNVNLREFPRTEALLDQILHSASTTLKFWFERLKEGSLHPDESIWASAISTNDFYQCFVDYSKDLGGKYRDDSGQFGKELKQICAPMKKKRKRISAVEREQQYTFPSLRECRSLFEEKVNMEIDWCDPENDEI